MIRADKKEVLRYLGYRKNQTLEPEISQLIDSLIDEGQSLVKAQHVFQIYELDKRIETQEIKLKQTTLTLSGKSIFNHLRKANRAALMAVTLGLPIEQRISYYSYQSMVKSLILDAVATALVEAYCDQIEAEICSNAQLQQLVINRRFSPGYGDLDLAIQSDFLAVLNAEKNIGLTCSENLIMMPRKSVTAVIGLFKESEVIKHKQGQVVCCSCNFKKSCQYKIIE